MSFETIVSSFDEDLDKTKYSSAADYALDTALHKVMDVSKSLATKDEERCLIIGADTVVDLAGEVMEKPGSEEDAFKMLSKLSGNTHEVHTGVAVCLKSDGEEVFTKCSETTSVTFAELPEGVIRAVSLPSF